MPAGGRHMARGTVLAVLRALALGRLAVAGASVIAVGAVGTVAAVAASAASAVTGAAGAEPPSPPLSDVVIPYLGPGYAISSQGPLNPSEFASDAPDPSAASGALATLGNTISTYERQWQANGGLNQVQDLVVRFPSATGALVFLQAAQRSLESGEIVSKGPLPAVPGARLVTYFAATNESGVGEAITMRAGTYVALLSFFSAAAGNSQPITPADAEKVALAQHTSLVSASGGKDATVPARESHNSASSVLGAPSKKGASSSDIGWAILAVVVVAAAAATPLLLHSRRRPADGLANGELGEPAAPA